MSYIAITLNHVRAIKAWAQAHDGQAKLDLLSFELEVKARHRYFTLYPQFLAIIDGRFAHVPQITADVSGFIGWLPYRAMRWPLSSDKRLFKRLLVDHGLPTPASWASPSEAKGDFIVKQAAGSFGFDMAGPFHEGDAAALFAGRPATESGLFAEQFVRGRNLKVWFWGDRAFHAQLHEYPRVTGDGRSTLRELAADRIGRDGVDFDHYKEMPFLLQAIKFQGRTLHDVLPAGDEHWLDFRYGRRFAPRATTAEADNALPQLGGPQRQMIDQTGRLIASELARTLAAPVLYSVDGVVDERGAIFWLEVNSNPMFVPTGYPFMLETLFGVAAAPAGTTPN